MGWCAACSLAVGLWCRGGGGTQRGKSRTRRGACWLWLVVVIVLLFVTDVTELLSLRLSSCVLLPPDVAP